MNKLLLFSLLCVVFFSCKETDEDAVKTTWIGGQIVNPKTDYVVILKDNFVIDTVFLNDKNFFLYKNDSIKSGLYSFQHNEYQIFFIEPGDSLLFRVNTVDFDESLTYTGRGAPENNLLMEFFLLNEQERPFMPEWFLLPPSQFEKKIDSLKKIRIALLNEFLSRHKPGREFKTIATASIDYSHYSKKELYTSASFSNMKKDEIPQDFYNYRKKVDFGSELLRSYYPYYRFLHRYFDNLAHQKYKNKGYMDRYGYLHNYYKLKLIDSVITNDSLKNNLTRTSAKWYFINGNTIENERTMLTLFNKINTNEYHRREVAALAEATKKLTPGNTLPNVLVVGYDNVMHELHLTITKPTVIYFWSGGSIKHFKEIHSRVAELSTKYPEYDFKGINTDRHFKRWREIVQKSGYNTLQEYQLENIEDAKNRLVINSVNKAIVVDKHAVILNGNTSLFSPIIENQLLGYLNK